MSLSLFSLPHSFSNIRNPNRITASSNPNSFQNIQIPSSPSIRTGVAILPVLSFEGVKIGETFLNLRIARPETARSVVHRGIVTFLRNKRRGTACTKGRGEVRGGGRKPYPQKGTGRARRGSQRTPLRRGGAVVFGPKPRDWRIKMNRKEKRLALATAIWSAAEDSIVLEDFIHRFDKPKTRDFLSAMKNWGVDPTKKSMFFLTEVSRTVRLCSRNINTLKMLTPLRFNLFDVLNSDKLVYTQASVDYLNAMYPSKRRFKLNRKRIVSAAGDAMGATKTGEEKENVVLDERDENVAEGDEYEKEEIDGDEDYDEEDDGDEDYDEEHDGDEDYDEEHDGDEDYGDEDYDEYGDAQEVGHG